MITLVLTLWVLATLLAAGVITLGVIFWYLVLPRQLHWTTERPGRDRRDDDRERHGQAPAGLAFDVIGSAGWPGRLLALIYGDDDRLTPPPGEDQAGLPSRSCQLT